MTQEKKAKAYDLALERAKKLQETCDSQAVVGWCEYIFPELKELGDEEVRKAMIDFFKHEREEGVVVTHYGVNIERMIAWLEKQGEQETDEWKEGNIIRHGGVLALVIKGRRAIKSNSELFTIQYPKEWVKAAPNEIEYFLNELEKQGEQKPADKVELKFKVGDWIVYDRHISKVKDMDSEGYLVEDTYGDEGILPKEFAEKHYHLWDVAKDAKDGDVLATPNYIYIFNSIDKETKTVAFYCLMKKSDEHFSFGDSEIHNESLNSIPATKEQRKTLEKAMSDAGFTFDFEKKELKKIEQNSTCSEDGEKIRKAILNYLTITWSNYQNDVCGVSVEDAMAWIEKHGEKPTAWSEEDSTYYDDISEILRNLILIETDKINKDFVQKDLDWLKSLKDRVQPQTQWKPSEDQIMCLQDALSDYHRRGYKAETLETLFKQLKQL